MEFISGILCGYLFGCFIGGKKEGEPGNIHFEWFIQKTKLHIHHWIIFSLLLIIYFCFCNTNMFITGFLSGGIIHGFTYNDWYKIIH